MGTYDTAKICIDGHLITSSMESSRNTDNNCTLCGAAVITKCSKCNAPIHGYYNVPGVLTFHDEPIPAFCHNCGSPYPWTESRLDTAEKIIDMLDELTVEQKKQLKDSLPDIIVETPRSQYAALVAGKFMALTNGLACESLKFWLTKYALPKIITLLNLNNL